MNLWDAVKAKLRWSSYGGQQNVIGGLSDWMTWHGRFPGTAYDYTQSVGRLQDNPIVMAAVAWMQRACTEPRVQVVREEASGEENPVPDHPLIDLLKRPNPHTTYRQLQQSTLQDWLLDGNAYWLKVRNGAGKVVELWHTPVNRMKPQWDTSGREFIGHYLLKVDGRDSIWQPEDVVHFRFGKHPDNERMGWSPLLAGMREVAALNEGANYRGALLRNRAVASHLVSSKDAAKPLNAEQARSLEALWISKTSGDGSGKPLFSSIPVDVEKLGYSPKDLDLGTMLNFDADLVCALLGLSSMVVGISSGTEHKTYANYSESREAAFEQAVIPTLWDLAEVMNLQLLPDFGDATEERVAFDLHSVRILQEDETEKWKRIDDAVSTGWLSVNEARSLVNLPPMKGHDDLETLKPEPSPFAPESQGDAAVQPEQPASRNGASNGNGKPR